MNGKYFLHFSWIITLVIFIYAILCIMDGISLVYPLKIYIVAMILYVIPMSYIMSQESKIICITFQNSIGKEELIEQTICNKTKRFLEYKEKNKKIFRKKNRYSKWLTNEVIVNIYDEKIELYIPKAYKKFFIDL